MSDLFIGPKWIANSLRLPITSMIAPNRLLGKIILTNLWPIARHTKLTIEKTQFVYVIMTDVPINLGTHFINMIKKAFSDKE
jgi:hypothetical protein